MQAVEAANGAYHPLDHLPILNYLKVLILARFLLSYKHGVSFASGHSYKV
jgi:hypothetical protein